MWILAVIIIVGVIALAYWFPGGNDSDSSDSVTAYNPYRKKQYYLSLAELNFYGILKNIIHDDFLIFPQVNLASIVDVRTDRWHRYKYRNRINRKIVDFVIFDKKYISPLLVIELDDSTHKWNSRIMRDELVNGVLLKAGINILHIKTQYNYNIPEITQLIREKFPKEIVPCQL